MTIKGAVNVLAHRSIDPSWARVQYTGRDQMLVVMKIDETMGGHRRLGLWDMKSQQAKGRHDPKLESSDSSDDEHHRLIPASATNRRNDRFWLWLRPKAFQNLQSGQKPEAGFCWLWPVSHSGLGDFLALA